MSTYLTQVTWAKSSYSGNGGANCVEWAPRTTHAVPVRDSKDPHGPALAFTPTAFAAFITTLKAGHFA
jgi:hypothetical protein